MHCGGAIANPEAAGRPGQDRSAGPNCIGPTGQSPWAEGSRLAGLRFEQAAHHLVVEDYIAAVEAAEDRRDRLTAQIEALLPDWTLAPGRVGAESNALVTCEF